MAASPCSCGGQTLPARSVLHTLRLRIPSFGFFRFEFDLLDKRHDFHLYRRSMMAYAETLQVFEQLQPGDAVELKHEVKVGYERWYTTTQGVVVKTERRRHGLHHRRQADDKVYSDILVLRREDGEVTTVTLDEFSELRKLSD